MPGALQSTEYCTAVTPECSPTQQGCTRPRSIVGSQLTRAAFETMSRKLFISYSHEDKSVAKHVAEALSQRGYEVFWDTKIPTGMTFDTYIYHCCIQEHSGVTAAHLRRR